LVDFLERSNPVKESRKALTIISRSFGVSVALISSGLLEDDSFASDGVHALIPSLSRTYGLIRIFRIVESRRMVAFTSAGRPRDSLSSIRSSSDAIRSRRLWILICCFCLFVKTLCGASICWRMPSGNLDQAHLPRSSSIHRKSLSESRGY